MESMITGLHVTQGFGGNAGNSLAQLQFEEGGDVGGTALLTAHSPQMCRARRLHFAFVCDAENLFM